MISLSVVIPAYNEEKTVADVARNTLAVLEGRLEDFEILLLDDCSTDGTRQIMRRLQEEHPTRIRTIFHERNRGIAETFLELQHAATKEFVMDIAGDGQIPPAILQKILPLLSTYDIVVCRRAHKGYSVARRILSWGYRALPKLLFDVELYDPGCAKCIRRSLIHEIPLRSSGVFREAERLIRAQLRGYRIGAVDVTPAPRPGGASHGAKPVLVLRALVDLVMLWVDLRLLRHNP